jgi:hypothetical protein
MYIHACKCVARQRYKSAPRTWVLEVLAIQQIKRFVERNEGALTLAAQVTCMIRSLHDLFWHSECSQCARVPVSRPFSFGYGIREYSLKVRLLFKRILSYTIAKTI